MADWSEYFDKFDQSAICFAKEIKLGGVYKDESGYFVISEINDGWMTTFDIETHIKDTVKILDFNKFSTTWLKIWEPNEK